MRLDLSTISRHSSRTRAPSSGSSLQKKPENATNEAVNARYPRTGCG